MSAVRRVLVTGAGGFSGRHACRHLTASGWEVVAVVSPRGLDGAGDLSAAHAECCDLTNGEAVSRLCRLVRPDAVLHLAGRNSVEFAWREPAAALMVNLMSTVYLLEGIRAGGGHCRMLAVGSMLGADAADHPYAFSKSLQSSAASVWQQWYGLPVIVVEPSNLFGPGGSAGLCGKIARWAAAMEESAGDPQPFGLSSLHESRDFLDIRDAVSAYAVLLEKGAPGQSYALESGDRHTLGDVKAAFERASTGALAWTVGNAAANPAPAARDTSPLRRLGWKPARDFYESIADTLAEERERRRLERAEGPSPS